MTVLKRMPFHLILLSTVILLSGCQMLSKLTANNAGSADNEINYGNQRAAEILAVAPLVQNEPLQRYVNQVGHWVAQQSSRPDLPWRFGLIQSDSIASLALPGGTVLISTAYFALLENEAQLAAILAHDIAHIDSRHYFMASHEQAWPDQFRRGLSPDLDFDADRNAAVFVARAGYDPFAFLDILTTLSSIDTGATEISYMNATHPSAETRLSLLADEMEGRLDAFADGQLNSERFLSFVR